MANKTTTTNKVTKATTNNKSNVKRGENKMKNTTTKNTTNTKTVKITVEEMLNEKGRLVQAVLGVPYVDKDSFTLLANKAYDLHGRCKSEIWRFRKDHKEDAEAFAKFVREAFAKGTIKTAKRPKKIERKPSKKAEVIIPEVVQETKSVRGKKVEVQSINDRVDKLEKEVTGMKKGIAENGKMLVTIMQELGIGKLSAPKKNVKRIASK